MDQAALDFQKYALSFKNWGLSYSRRNWDILLTIAVTVAAFFYMFGTDILLFQNI